MINFYNYLTDKKVSQSLYEMLFDKFMQSDTPTYREYTGTLPVTITANGSDLVDWIIYGNTGGVGNRTDNLFDGQLQQGYYAYVTGDYTLADAYVCTYLIPCTENTTYTFRCINTGGGSKNYGYVFFNSSQSRIGSDFISEQTEGDVVTHTATSPQNAAFLAINIAYGSRQSSIVHPSDITDFMLNTGSTALPYEPYGYKITILSNSEPTDIYIDAPLGANETVSFADTNVHIPTNNGSTVISCDNTVQPEKMYIKYIGG